MSIRIIRESIDDTILRLAREVNRCEARGGYSTGEMIKRLEAGTLKQTSDICDWLMAANQLDHMQKLKGK